MVVLGKVRVLDSNVIPRTMKLFRTLSVGMMAISYDAFGSFLPRQISRPIFSARGGSQAPKPTLTKKLPVVSVIFLSESGKSYATYSAVYNKSSDESEWPPQWLLAESSEGTTCRTVAAVSNLVVVVLPASPTEHFIGNLTEGLRIRLDAGLETKILLVDDSSDLEEAPSGILSHRTFEYVDELSIVSSSSWANKVHDQLVDCVGIVDDFLTFQKLLETMHEGDSQDPGGCFKVQTRDMKRIDGISYKHLLESLEPQNNGRDDWQSAEQTSLDETMKKNNGNVQELALVQETFDAAIASDVTPHFKGLVDPILVHFYSERSNKDIESDDQMLSTVKGLYKQYLNFNRDKFGGQFEDLIDRDFDNAREWPHYAKMVSSDFSSEVLSSIPSAMRDGGPLADFAEVEYAVSLSGLLQDMREISESRQEFDVDSLPQSQETKRFPRLRRLATWLRTRIIVLAVNYAQGWLAWQGIRQAALKREKAMPKFPLF